MNSLASGQPVDDAVVAAIGAVGALVVGVGGQDVKHRHAEIELGGGGLSSCHVELEPLGFIAGVFFFELRTQRIQFGSR